LIMSKYGSVGSMRGAAWALAAAWAIAAPQPANAQSSNKWEGPYAGLNIGGMWSSTSAAIGMNATGGGFSGTGSGFLGGVQAGYNWMLGPVLLGPEIDFQGSTLTSNIVGGAGASSINAVAKTPWFSTWRVRAGYPVGSVMPYVTAGAVWGRQTLEGNDSANGGYFNVSNNFWTYAVGGGVEGHLSDQWSAKLEYLYLGTPDTPLSAPATTSISERAIGNVVRVGLNYRF
jgi:outer membrane immunogenic protein